MPEEKQLTEQESLQLITSMIQKVKGGYHENGTGPILWGTVVSIASFVTYLQREYLFDLPFDIWLIVMAAIIPQIIMVRKERRTRPHIKYEDEAINAVWIVYALTIFGLTAYQAIVPEVSANLLKEEGWQMMKHVLDNSKPDEVLTPFTPSLYSIYILVYAFPTLVTGITKKFTPMLVGSGIAYTCFIISLYTASKYDFLLGAVTAITCWFIPGLILRKRYLAQKRQHV
ncbi:MAG: hypothetical protein B7Y15_14535 [Bacteroidetes bacterium 24-39-8]|jgi:hypothetical protein|nr:MAG: hypothetical protein B7Y69_11355 [Sphingobacteriia bacterium 35-40-8]OYZ47371.1 MAG: hypothetical protein B7Y15_14535 [Bacteroidetes bacterium 24-39-8]HQR94507.1 hypothetical protein [Sediminibacterium sp.]HQS56412.1 hypothetical protein [Sediminibacterium sp.]